MQNSYRGNLRGNAAYINRDGFVGQNKGALANALKTFKTGYELYHMIPAKYRYRWFGDDEAFREDQESQNPELNPDGTDRISTPSQLAEKEAKEKEAAKRNEVATEKVAGEGMGYGEGRGTGDNYAESMSAGDAWDAGKLATEAYNNAQSQGEITAGKSWNPSTKVDSVKADETMEFDENGSALDWQRYLNTQGYNLVEDGKWGAKSQRAYDDWLSKRPLPRYTEEQ